MTDRTSPDAVYLKPREAAEILRVSFRTLQRWEAEGKVRGARLPNGHRRYLRSDIEQLLAAS